MLRTTVQLWLERHRSPWPGGGRPRGGQGRGLPGGQAQHPALVQPDAADAQADLLRVLLTSIQTQADQALLAMQGSDKPIAVAAIGQVAETVCGLNATCQELLLRRRPPGGSVSGPMATSR